MKCRELRDRLTNGDGPREAFEDHLGTCEACSLFAARLDEARRALNDHHAGVEPNAAFAARVVSHLPAGEPDDALSWAALRVLPATLALLLALVWLAVQTSPDPSSLFSESPTDDVLSWVADLSEVDR